MVVVEVCGMVDLAAVAVVMLAGTGMTEAHKIDITIWMGVDGAVSGAGDGLTTTEEMLETGAEAEAIALVLKGFEHGVIVGAEVGAEVEAEVGVAAGVTAEAGPAAVAPDAAIAAAAAVAMRDVKGHLVNRNLIRWNPQCQKLGRLLYQGCLLCPQAHKAKHFLEVSFRASYHELRMLSQDIKRLRRNHPIQLVNVKVEVGLLARFG